MYKKGVIYIMTNKWRSTLYIGVTSDLRQRMYQHQVKHYYNSFTARYNLDPPVYYEIFEDIEEAIM